MWSETDCLNLSVGDGHGAHAVVEHGCNSFKRVPFIGLDGFCAAFEALSL